MKKSIFTLLLSFFIGIAGNAQGLENDLQIMYMKANVLYDTGRFDEAVRMYNRILSENEQHSMALFMRAKCKYELAAFKGTKMDIMKYIEMAGINKDLIQLMIKTELKLSNFLAAESYATTAIELDPYDPELYFMQGLVLSNLQRKSEACESFARAAQLGDSRGRDKLLQDCDGIIISPKRIEVPETLTENEMDERRIPDTLQVLGQLDETEDPILAPVLLEDLETENVVNIDDELNLVFTRGIGTRKVEFIPDILMLTERKGAVILKICINSEGKVITAEYDPDNSEIMSSAMISLAIRKTREILFLPSLRASQCGVVKFVFN